MWSRSLWVCASCGQRLSVVHGLCTRPHGHRLIRRTRPHIHGLFCSQTGSVTFREDDVNQSGLNCLHGLFGFIFPLYLFGWLFFCVDIFGLSAGFSQTEYESLWPFAHKLISPFKCRLTSSFCFGLTDLACCFLIWKYWFSKRIIQSLCRVRSYSQQKISFRARILSTWTCASSSLAGFLANLVFSLVIKPPDNNLLACLMVLMPFSFSSFTSLSW